MRIPQRRKEEFYCANAGGGCENYFLTFLRRNMNGNYIIECPGCEHHHYRQIKEGFVTGDRHYDKEDIAEVILGLKSTLREKPWTDDPEFKRMQMRVVEASRIEGLM